LTRRSEAAFYYNGSALEQGELVQAAAEGVDFVLKLGYVCVILVDGVYAALKTVLSILDA
jgi:hypothetical protein